MTLQDLTEIGNLEKLAAYRASRGERATQLIPQFRALLGFPHLERLIAAMAVLPQGTFFLRSGLVTLLESWDMTDGNFTEVPDEPLPSRTRAIRVFVDEWVRERGEVKRWQYAGCNDFHNAVANALKIPAKVPDYRDIAFAGVTQRLQRSRAKVMATPIRLLDWLDAAKGLDMGVEVKDVLEGKYLASITILERGRGL